ncbi:MAG: 3'(2'),5'-bisphosphate nucleotidase CysQ, partial [Thaumarchaeota archaeon]|nr:3'(2'),5'-bisphosphate nucleotidase CysQ [Nitrososphaerota archaeon]
MDVPKLPFETNLSELQIAVNAAIDAGKEILQVYSKDFSSDVKIDDSPITEADLKSNKIIKNILSKTNFDILSEEDKDDEKRLGQNKIWIIDPLDGTTD